MSGMRGGFSYDDGNTIFAWHYTKYGTLDTNCHANGVTVECTIAPHSYDPHVAVRRYDVHIWIKPGDEKWKITSVLNEMLDAIYWAEQMIYHLVSHHKPGKRENAEGYPVIDLEKPENPWVGKPDPTEGLGY